MPEGKPIKITPAKGRPMLTWVGKRPLSQVTAFPAQHIETFNPTGDAARRAAQRDAWADWPDRYPRGGLLFHGDNKEVLAHMLACELVGIERTGTDPFFDGTLGRNLVKIIPLNHPLSPLDLEEIRRELEARPEEDRNITVVCLGKELAADVWIEDWNRLRKGKKAVNRIEVIELRTDPRYGKFFENKPASARLKITRKRGQIHVEIEDFISPSIIERLQQQAGVLKPQVEDWRAMVDCVMIDPAYDGEVFNVALSDVPAKKDDLVSGTYSLPAPDGETTVAVKIMDMLGEEVLVRKRV